MCMFLLNVNILLQRQRQLKRESREEKVIIMLMTEARLKGNEESCMLSGLSLALATNPSHLRTFSSLLHSTIQGENKSCFFEKKK